MARLDRELGREAAGPQGQVAEDRWTSGVRPLGLFKGILLESLEAVRYNRFGD